MKKTYMQPLTEVVRINAEVMICQSQVGLKSVEIDGTEEGFQKVGVGDEEYNGFDW